MNLRRPIRAFRRAIRLGLAALAAGTSAWPCAAMSNPPNIVLVLADDLGARDLACDGADLHETPAIDALAAKGLRFRHAYSASPVCTPARAGMLTGKHPARLGITVWSEAAASPPPRKNKLLPAPSLDHLPLREVTLAEVLRERGYTTGHVGKWHLGSESYGSQAQGFEYSVGGNHWGAPQTFFWPFLGDKRFRGEFRYVPGLPLGKPGDYLSDVLTVEATKFIDSALERKRPFFLYLAHYAPHTPIEAKPQDIEYFERKLRPEHKHRNAIYAGMIRILDQNVAALVAHLEKRGIIDNTLIVFTSDNGGFINNDTGARIPVTTNAPLRSGKGAVYEGGIRVPLIIAGPGVSVGVCDRPVWLPDLFPTLLAAAGLKDPKAEDGLDLTALLRDPREILPRDELHWHYPHYYPTTTPVSAIRSGDWKLVEYVEGDRVELYNLGPDVSENTDLARQMPEKTAELRRRLHAWREAVGAKLATPNPQYAK